MVVDGETGVLVPPKSPGRLTATLDRLLDEPARLREMGRAGLERLLDQQWTWSHHAEQVTEVHAEVRAEW